MEVEVLTANQSSEGSQQPHVNPTPAPYDVSAGSAETFDRPRRSQSSSWTADVALAHQSNWLVSRLHIFAEKIIIQTVEGDGSPTTTKVFSSHPTNIAFVKPLQPDHSPYFKLTSGENTTVFTLLHHCDPADLLQRLQKTCSNINRSVKSQTQSQAQLASSGTHERANPGRTKGVTKTVLSRSITVPEQSKSATNLVWTKNTTNPGSMLDIANLSKNRVPIRTIAESFVSGDNGLKNEETVNRIYGGRPQSMSKSKAKYLRSLVKAMIDEAEAVLDDPVHCKVTARLRLLEQKNSLSLFRDSFCKNIPQQQLNKLAGAGLMVNEMNVVIRKLESKIYGASALQPLNHDNYRPKAPQKPEVSFESMEQTPNNMAALKSQATVVQNKRLLSNWLPRSTVLRRQKPLTISLSGRPASEKTETSTYTVGGRATLEWLKRCYNELARKH